MNKKWLSLIILGLVLIMAVPALAGCSSPAVAESTPSPVTTLPIQPVQVSQQPQGIWVSGTGEVSITPDIATLNIGVMAQEASVAQAQSEASDAMTKVMKALTDAGIAQKDIQTGYFSITQQTNWDDLKKTNTITGYQVTNMVTVKIRDTTKVGDIIDAVVAAGGNFIRINGISFSVEDPSQYYQEARTKAMADAQNKAEQLAKLAGVTLGKPTYVVEGAQSSPIYSSGYAGAPMTIAAPAPMIAVPPINPGQNKITLNVQVAYSVTQ